MKHAPTLFAFSLLGILVSCSAAEQNDQANLHFTSARATLLSFEFDGKIILDSTSNPESAIKGEQLLYTIGQLNDIGTTTGKGAVGRLDATVIENLQKEVLPSGKVLFKYHAKMPVGWTNQGMIPKSYQLQIPLDFSDAGISTFISKHNGTCYDLWSGHAGLGRGDFWYYYRPQARGCVVNPVDFMISDATVSVSTENTKDKYPEYDMIWKDNTLNVIVLFGRDVAGTSSVSDFGVGQYSQFNYKMRWAGLDTKLKPTPENILQAPGSESPDVEWNGTFPDGRKIRVNALLIDNPRRTTPEFDARYAALSGEADVIIYNGHAALGGNVRALTRKGNFKTGQYTIVSMMGCDSFAYVDGYMASERARLNADDPNGTKYLDMITNVTPTNPVKLSYAALELIRALSDVKKPKTYNQILQSYEFDHFAVVTGEQDNSFTPAAKSVQSIQSNEKSR